MDKFNKMRLKEGKAIASDIKKIIKESVTCTKRIEKSMPKINQGYEKKLRDKIEMLIGKGYDESRVITEAALMAAKSDINEEIIRLESHFIQLGETLESDDEIGKKMDFIVQEILREVNTIGSKVGDVAVTRDVVFLKNQVEKLKEHVRNIE